MKATRLSCCSWGMRTWMAPAPNASAVPGAKALLTACCTASAAWKSGRFIVSTMRSPSVMVEGTSRSMVAPSGTRPEVTWFFRTEGASGGVGVESSGGNGALGEGIDGFGGSWPVEVGLEEHASFEAFAIGQGVDFDVDTGYLLSRRLRRVPVTMTMALFLPERDFTLSTSMPMRSKSRCWASADKAAFVACAGEAYHETDAFEFVGPCALHFTQVADAGRGGARSTQARGRPVRPSQRALWGEEVCFSCLTSGVRRERTSRGFW